jgi:CPA2 family monovalent cation:H+ antiporter-2
MVRKCRKGVPSVEDVHIIVDMVMALGIATIAGLVASRLRVPVLLGYVLAGVIIGPYSPGFGADQERVIQLANLGVAFLMFALGAEFSIRDLLVVRKTALTAAAIQIPGTFAVGIFAGQLIGWDVRASILLGGIFAISSSIVMIKLLLDRGETSSPETCMSLSGDRCSKPGWRWRWWRSSVRALCPGCSIE